jgi:hypothetical protein
MNFSSCTPVAAIPPRQPDDAGMQVLEFACQGRRFAIPLDSVRRAVPSARPDGLCVVIDPARFLFEHERAQLARAGADDERH